MLAVLLTGTSDEPRVEVGHVDRPNDEAGRVVVEVAAAGISKMEPRWLPGWQKADGNPQSRPLVLGCEFAGRIRSMGADVDGFVVGQRVMGATDQYEKGAMAEFVSVEAGDVLPLPDEVPLDQASTLPLAGLTAWQALVRYGALERDQRVLIHGGAGGVGTFAIQIARWIGAYVVVTASSKDGDLCKHLGADEVVDFRHEQFEDRGGDYDLVFDQVGADVQERSWDVVKRGGRLITIAGEETDAPDQTRARALGISARFFIVDRNTKELGQITHLVAAGTLRPIVGKHYGFSSVVEAFDRRSGHFAGKAVLMCAEPI